MVDQDSEIYYRDLVRKNATVLSLDGIESANLKTKKLMFDRLTKLLNEIQEEPTLLDPYMERIVFKVAECLKEISIMSWAAPQEPILCANAASELLYTFSKVRGRKIVEKFLPTNAQDFELYVNLYLRIFEVTSENRKNKVTDEVLCTMEGNGGRSEDVSTHFPNFDWHSQYSMLYILSLLFLLPFNLCVLDSRFEDEFFVSRLMEVLVGVLGNASVLSRVASLCLCRLVSRIDMNTKYFRPLAERMIELFSLENSQNNYVAIGCLRLLRDLFKHGEATDLDFLVELVFYHFGDLLEKKEDDIISSARCKVIAKVFESATLHILDKSSPGEEPVNDDGDRAEKVVQFLIKALKSRYGVVRETAAESISRIATRLPKEIVSDIVKFLLEYLVEEEQDTTWQGACHCLAKLARRGLLSRASLLKQTMPKIVEALHYDVRKGKISVGTAVRDNACFVCWALARSCSRDIMTASEVDLSIPLLVRALSDREVNIRRSAMAAYQEHLGRNGLFPSGIEVMQICDYYSLGPVKNVYRSVIPRLISLKHYREAILKVILTKNLVHWDKKLRELSAETLAIISKQSGDILFREALDDIISNSLHTDVTIRHGNSLALALIVKSAGIITDEAGQELPTLTQQQAILKVLPSVEKLRLYKGRGGEWIRYNMCLLVDGISTAKYPLLPKMLKPYHLSIEENIRHYNCLVRSAATDALGPMMSAFYSPTGNGYKLFIKKFVGGLNSKSNASIRRGYSQALGAIPAKFINDENVDSIFDSLLSAARKEDNKDEEDYETRANALRSLGMLSEKMARNGQLNVRRMEGILSSLHFGCNDYSVDERGDVGSKIRVQIIHTFDVVLRSSLVADENGNCTNCLCYEKEINFFVGFLLTQMGGTMNSLRAASGKKLAEVIEDAPYADRISERESILEKLIKPLESFNNWDNPDDVFQNLIQLSRFESLRFHVLLGLLESLGGLSSHVVSAAEDAFRHFIPPANEVQSILASMKDTLQAHLTIEKRFLKLCRGFNKVSLMKWGFAPLPAASNTVCASHDTDISRVTIVNNHLVLDLLRERLSMSGGLKGGFQLLSAISECLCYFAAVPETSNDAIELLARYLKSEYPTLRNRVASCLIDSLKRYSSHHKMIAGVECEKTKIREILEDTDWLHGNSKEITSSTEQLLAVWSEQRE